MEREQIVDAATELNEVLGLDPEIDVKLSTADLKGKIVEASELIGPGDDISKETQEVLNALKPEPEAEEEKPKKKKPKVATGTKKKVAAGTSPGALAAKERGPMTTFVNNLMVKGLAWDKLVEKAAAEAESRGSKNLGTEAHLKSHVGNLKKSGKWTVEEVDGTIKITPVVEAVAAE